MSRLLKILALALGFLLVSAYGYGRVKNPEKRELTLAAREQAPGEFVSLSGGATYYEVAGPDTGRVAILVHGFSVPSYIWDSTFNALAASGHRVYRYDLFGRGWSDRPDAKYDSAMYVNQLDELMDSLHITTKVDLVGLSFGGFVTGRFTAARPARVRTLTLVDPVAQGRTMPGFLKTPVIGEWVWQVTQVPGMAEGQSSDFLHPERYPTWADQYRTQMQFAGFGRSLLRSAINSMTVDFAALYKAVGATGIPVLLIWGKQDQTVPIALADVVRGGIPSVEFFPVDSAGHLPHIEQSATVHARMRSFFAAHP